MTTLRYRANGLPTFRVKAKFPNVARLGRLVKIEGVRYNASNKGIPVVQEVVKVTGLNGTARFSGLLWGYHGEGPRGFVSLLQFCGIKKEIAEIIAFNSPRLDHVGTDFVVEFGAGALNQIMVTWNGHGITKCITDVFENVRPYSLLQ